MTVTELKEILEDMNPDAEVRFASQPSWPFEYDITDAIETNQCECPPDDCTCEDEVVVYLVEGSQLGYLPSEAKEAIGW